MSAERRWQDWGITIAGLLLLISPPAFASTPTAGEAWIGYILGAVILVVGAAMLLYREFRFLGEVIQIVAGVVTFFAPWLFGFTGVVLMAWTAWIIGLAVLLLVSSEFAVGWERRAAAAA